jgi:hypothetical protein
MDNEPISLDTCSCKTQFIGLNQGNLLYLAKYNATFELDIYSLNILIEVLL